MTVSAKQPSRNMDAIYFLLTTLFFYTQLHTAILFAWVHTITLETLILDLLCFKLGEATHELFDGGKAILWISGAFVAAIAIFRFPEFFPAFFLFGLCMMKIRDEAAKKSSRTVKIAARAVGFLATPFHSVLVYYPFVIAVFTYCFSQVKQLQAGISPNRHWFKLPENKTVYLTMTAHHTHYFIYAYSIPYAFARHTQLPAAWMGLIFYVGWAAYNAYEKLVKPSWKLFIIGHVIAIVALLGVYESTSLVPLAFWWFMTGLGGGTIYMLHSLLRRQHPHAGRELRIAEGAGHVLGITLWGLISWLVSVEQTYIGGAILAVITIVLAVNAATVERRLGGLQQSV